jgi:hypothetical protein
VTVTSPVLFFTVYGAIAFTIVTLLCLAPTRLFYERIEDKSFILKKRRLLISAFLFVLCLLPIWMFRPVMIASMLHNGQRVAVDSVNQNRLAVAMTLQAMGTLYPALDSSCAWRTAVSFLDEVQGKLYHKHFCNHDSSVCASSMQDVYVQNYNLTDDGQHNMLRDFNSIEFAAEAVWKISHEKYRLLRSVMKHKGAISSEEEKGMSEKFYEQPDLPTYLALWDQKLKQCQSLQAPAWADDMANPMPIQHSGGLIARWTRYE